MGLARGMLLTIANDAETVAGNDARFDAEYHTLRHPWRSCAAVHDHS